ncbi:hypothetical protein AAF712_002379 [Marasmius tenuissimus]|uniref:DUF7962 domain-containing protein n=1 Tax=Marasmius tenuissimus TaxID=585030 RepID=A0ABR3AAK9_9AGAR
MTSTAIAGPYFSSAYPTSADIPYLRLHLSSLIVPTLERRFPSSEGGRDTVFSPSKHGGGPNTSLLKAFARHYGDTVLLRLAVGLISWDNANPEALKDRSKVKSLVSLLFGAPIDPQEWAEHRPKVLSELTSHIALIENQLADGREWLLDTVSPGLADLSVHYIYSWVMLNSMGFFNSEVVNSLFERSRFPKTIKWLEHFNEFTDNLKKDSATPTVIDGKEAAQQIAEASHEPNDVVGFDETHANWLGLKRGATVHIRPEDYGKEWPHTGKLIGLNHEEFCVESQGSSGTFRVHFPRIGFTIEAV